jgi:GAF domain-containing protein
MQAKLNQLEQLRDKPMQETIDAYVDAAIELTGSQIGYFAILSWSEDELTMLGWSKTAMDACQMVGKPIIYKLEETGLWGDCVREREAVITNDYEKSNAPNKKGYPKGHVAVTRHMNVPVRDSKKIRGILGVGNKTSDYSMSEAQQLQEFADNGWKYVREALAL